MTCTSCFAELSSEARFCGNCGTPVGVTKRPAGIFDSARARSGSLEEFETLAWDTLAPHVEEARKAESSYLFTRGDEWLARLISTRVYGPIPEMRANTPFVAIVWALVKAREEYDDVILTDLEELARTCAVRISLMDSDPQDLERWKVIIDPDGLRIKPTIMLPISIEPVGDQLLQSAWWQLDSETFANAPRPLTVALVRPPFPELRYVFRAEMR